MICCHVVRTWCTDPFGCWLIRRHLLPQIVSRQIIMVCQHIKVLYLFYFVCFCCKMFEHFLNYCLVYTQDLYVLFNWLPSILLPFGESLSLVVCAWLGGHLSGSLCMLHSITLLCILLSQGEYTVTTVYDPISLYSCDMLKPTHSP